MRDLILFIFHVDEGFDDWQGLHTSVADILEISDLDVDLCVGDGSAQADRSCFTLNIYDPWEMAPHDSLLDQVVAFAVRKDACDAEDVDLYGVLHDALLEEE